MVYDTLLATDANSKVQPQMADSKVSDDWLTYTSHAESISVTAD